MVATGFLAITAYFLVWTYHHAIEQAQQAELLRLQGITNTLALQLDGDAHMALMSRHRQKDAIVRSDQDSLYHSLHEVLAQNAAANMLKTPIYTIVFDTLVSHYAFGVTSAAQPYFRHAYTSYPKILMEKQAEGAMIPMYEDEFGTWLSAFSVLKNRRGEAVALVQADEPFDVFLVTARREAFKNLSVSLLVFTILLLTLLRVLQTILLKEQRQKAALAAANEQITRLDHFRKEMLANVSHDLRTPVTNILGFAQTLLQKNDLTAEEQARYLGIISKSAKRMDAMIGEIFDLSKLEAGQIVLKKEPFNLAELAQDTLYAQNEQARGKQVNLFTEFQEALPQVEADIFWIDRVLQNLLTNAFKHVNDGGFIKCSIFTENEQLNLKICNSGIPIKQEDLAYIFDRYFKSSNHQSGGTGLGLAIAHKIIDLHGGKIWAEVNGDVTTFRFYLKLKS